jgi:protoheme ferro-lyase
VEEVIAAYAKAGKSTIVSSAIGFLCDNIEVLHDLGVEGERCAAQHGVRFVRAESVHRHPAFIRMLADHVADKLG